MTTTLRVVGYLRVSAAHQAEGYGLAAQRRDIEGWATRGGHTVVWPEGGGDVQSGKASMGDRRGLATAVAMAVDLGCQGLVAGKRDRFARDPLVAGLVEQDLRRRLGLGPTAQVLYSADGAGQGDAPHDQFLRGILDLVAQYERYQILMRTGGGKRVAQEVEGRWVGGKPPYGYTCGQGGVLAADEQEKGVVGAVFSMRDAGLKGTAIAAALAERGHHPRNGGTWQASTVREILRREPFYRGQATLGGHVPANGCKHKPLL